MDGKALLTWNRMIFTMIKTPGQLHIVLSDYYDNIVMITLVIYIFSLNHAQVCSFFNVKKFLFLLQ